jgi:hypothetical protein
MRVRTTPQKEADMENAKVTSETVKIRIRIELQEAKSAGRTRTELLNALRVPRDLLAAAIDEMITEFEIAAHVMRKRAFALGRPVTRYWLCAYAPADLTPPPPSDIASPTEEAAPSGRTCRQCGVAIAKRGPAYCSKPCERLAQAGSVTVADFMGRARDPMTFARCARLLVEMDLLCRGFQATPAVDGGCLLLVFDASGAAAVLHVFPLADVGGLPPLQEYTHAACVYRDGRIAYGGKIPLVTVPELSEDSATGEQPA